MDEMLSTYIGAWPEAWAVDTARYLVAASVMAAIIATFWQSCNRTFSCSTAPCGRTLLTAARCDR